MNTKQDDGGPAFPRPSSRDSDGFAEDAQDGMSLRDWFAGMALQGILANPSFESITPDEYTNDAFSIADAMLAARKEAR